MLSAFKSLNAHGVYLRDIINEEPLFFWTFMPLFDEKPQQLAHSIMQFISYGDVDGLEVYLSKIKPDSLQKIFNTPAYEGRSFLSFLISQREFLDNSTNAAILRVLINHGANPAKRDNKEVNEFQNTALLNAIAYEKWDLALAMLDSYDPTKHEDYINLPSLFVEGKSSPLIFALKKQIAPRELLLALIQKGADVNFQTHRGETPLHYAAYFSNNEILEAMLQHHPNLDLKNSSGMRACDFYQQRLDHLPFFSEFPIVIEKDGFPLIVKQDSLGSRRIPPGVMAQIPLHLRNELFRYLDLQTDPRYPVISNSLEFVQPFSPNANPEALLSSPSADMLNRLSTTPIQENSFFTTVLPRYKSAFDKQQRLFEKGKYYVESTNPEVNEVLKVLNDYILKTDKLAFDYFELRFEIAACQNVAEIKTLLSSEYYVHLKTDFLKAECDKIDGSHLNAKPTL